MPFKYKKVLLLGATSGIGHALAARFVETGTGVIVVGRRKENLDKFIQQYGSKGDVDQATFDITDLANIPSFVQEQFSKHSDIDCVFINAGVQRHLDWTKPEEVNLDNIDLEIKSNYLSYLHLTKAVLPYLSKAQGETAIIYTSSGLALVPNLKNPNYCATKAALHHMLLVLRQQLKDINSNVKIIELLPPAVQTELHDAKHQPEYGDRGRHLGMPLDEFTEEAYNGLCSENNEQVPVGMVKTHMGWNDWEAERQKGFAKITEMMKQQK
ncbi:hypothetical protein AMS68_006777 [Peltaster fructicola]|uniref:Uncharacterized protein n=1 Tax=Peltaster fructicola TaxID=286661 RepID=A0A6H0Y3Q5_9PEZI|nr:hypothetical protein AMS68_006777 [Peltaster fructicola]